MPLPQRQNLGTSDTKTLKQRQWEAVEDADALAEERGITVPRVGQGLTGNQIAAIAHEFDALEKVDADLSVDTMTFQPQGRKHIVLAADGGVEIDDTAGHEVYERKDGLVVPRTALPPPTRGIIVASGPGEFVFGSGFVAPQFTPGDWVIFNPKGGFSRARFASLPGYSFFVLSETEIHAKVGHTERPD